MALPGDCASLSAMPVVEENTSSPPSASPPKPRTDLQEALSFGKTLLLFLLAAFLLRASVVEAFRIPSLSMFPTLRIGDHILVSKLSYGLRLPLMTDSAFMFSFPKRGDIVVFTRPDEPGTTEDESAINIIKRVVAIAGDTVEVRDTRVFINGVVQNEPFARWQLNGIPDGYFGPERVPEGHVFLMGDNRDHSKDSRFWASPFLDVHRIKGRALMIYWSWDGLDRIGTILR